MMEPHYMYIVSSQQRWTEIFPAQNKLSLKLINKLTALWEYSAWRINTVQMRYQQTLHLIPMPKPPEPVQFLLTTLHSH